MNRVATGSTYAVPVVLTKSAYCFGSRAKFMNASTSGSTFDDFRAIQPSI